MAIVYSPLKDTLCIESAMAQSAHALDLAARLAVESRDIDALMKVAQGWAELTKGLHFDSKENRDNLGISDQKDKNNFKVGFNNNG